jgi:hypothetical protein
MELPFIAGLLGVITGAVTLSWRALTRSCASARVAVPAKRRGSGSNPASSIRGTQFSVPIM